MLLRISKLLSVIEIQRKIIELATPVPALKEQIGVFSEKKDVVETSINTGIGRKWRNSSKY